MTPTRLAFAALLLLGSVATPAAAELTTPTGQFCRFSGLDAVTEFEAGPLSLVDEDDPSVPHTATITCSIQTGHAHSEPDWLTVTSAPGTGVAYLPPTLVPTPGPWPWSYTYCTRLDVVGEPTLYWHDPADRNSDGWWTTDPNARCQGTAEHADIRPEDPPQGWISSALATVGGDLDTAVDVVEPVICAEPALGPVTDLTWSCGAPTTSSSSVSFVRTPSATVLRTMPFGWTCTDVHTGLGVTRGSSLVAPDPGVSCTPPSGYDVRCGWADVSGTLAPTTLGRVDITVACDDGEVTRRLAPAQAQVWVQWSGAHMGRPPLRCAAREDTTGPVDPAYVVACSIT